MAPGPVVEHFNVIEDIGPGQIPGFIDAFSDPLFFQRTEERFGHRINAPVVRPLSLGKIRQLLKKVRHFMETLSPFPGGKHVLAKM